MFAPEFSRPIQTNACIMQVEYLWAPCSFLEPSGAPVVEVVGDGDGGVVTVVPVGLRATMQVSCSCCLSQPLRVAQTLVLQWALSPFMRVMHFTNLNLSQPTA